ncbi:hypothetical protein I5Q34_09740 [Streptomyces sp. AV19]|uniref:DUF6274 family protein n=1 Tax=Streptomyces sp. AV19 TaxID=2793068 RepID=UPI0018FE7DFD|nr:DUF6274 family protein [Streptomyces sp. AV19]MBH1934560.1 hypothetical protein [Streptomyces sp. AV19]MDG4530892.1 DUF6274 family protein [Streptomyces sp. AV19]
MTTTPRPGGSRHETGALLRAHLSAVVGQGHLTRRCAVCHRLLRLALGPRADGDRVGRAGRDGGSVAW